MADTPEAPAPDESAAAPAGGLKRRLPLIAALAGGLAVGAGTGAVLVGPVAAKALGFAADPASSHAPAADDGHGEEAADDGHGEEADSAGSSADEPLVTTLENLVLNPAASGGTRFLLLTVAMECSTEDCMNTLRTKDAELRDVVLTSLSRKTVEELADVTARDDIKGELRSALNERFGKNMVLRVYFPQYVVQ